MASAFVSAKLGFSVAIFAMIIGMLAGQILGFSISGHDWLFFLAGFGSVVLTFLAGGESAPEPMRMNRKASISIGMLSFPAPFLGTLSISYLLLGWARPAAPLDLHDRAVGSTDYDGRGGTGGLRPGSTLWA